MAGGAEQAREGRRFAWRLSVFFAATFLVAGVKMPYLPVWLDWRGLSAAEIGVIASAPLFLRIAATPVIGYLADRHGDHRRVVIGLAWAAVAVLIALGAAAGFLQVLLLTLVLSLATTSIFPLTETIAMGGVKRSGLDYGRMRLWGSLSFIVAGFAAALVVERHGVGAVLPVLIGAAVLAGIAAHLLPRAPGEAAASVRRRLVPGDVVALLVSPRFALFLVAVGAVQAAHAVFYTFGVLHWRAQGISPVAASLLWSVGVAAEIGLFAYSGLVVGRLGAVGLMLAAAVAALLRWVVMAFDPPLAVLLPLQALHGLTYGAAHLGAVHFIGATVPESQVGTAQGLYSTVTSGIAMGLATLVAGWLYPRYGGLSYLAMAGLGLIGSAASIALLRVPASRTPAV